MPPNLNCVILLVGAVIMKRTPKVNLSYPVVVFDTETGGLSGSAQIEWDLTEDLSEIGKEITGKVKKAPAPILEIGAVVLNPITLEEEAHFHTYCGPDAGESLESLLSRCDAEALRVNGFDQGERREALRQAPSMKEAIESWVKWIRVSTDSKHHLKTRKFIPCGQNVRFDIDMINSACQREGIRFALKTQPIELINFAMVYFGLPHTGSVARYKLEVIAEALGIPTEDAHTALADVRMTAECLRIFLNEFTGN